MSDKELRVKLTGRGRAVFAAELPPIGGHRWKWPLCWLRRQWRGSGHDFWPDPSLPLRQPRCRRCRTTWNEHYSDTTRTRP